MKVFVYRNLRYRNKVMWSIKDVKTGLVISVEPTVVLKDVKLKVSLAGNKRVRKEKRKNVHAGVVGELKGPMDLLDGKWKQVTYNPYKHKSFVYKSNGKKVTEAKMAMLTNALWVIK